MSRFVDGIDIQASKITDEELKTFNKFNKFFVIRDKGELFTVPRKNLELVRPLYEIVKE